MLVADQIAKKRLQKGKKRTTIYRKGQDQKWTRNEKSFEMQYNFSCLQQALL